MKILLILFSISLSSWFIQHQGNSVRATAKKVKVFTRLFSDRFIVTFYGFTNVHMNKEGNKIRLLSTFNESLLSNIARQPHKKTLEIMYALGNIFVDQNTPPHILSVRIKRALPDADTSKTQIEIINIGRYGYLVLQGCKVIKAMNVPPPKDLHFCPINSGLFDPNSEVYTNEIEADENTKILMGNTGIVRNLQAQEVERICEENDDYNPFIINEILKGAQGLHTDPEEGLSSDESLEGTNYRKYEDFYVSIISFHNNSPVKPDKLREEREQHNRNRIPLPVRRYSLMRPPPRNPPTLPIYKPKESVLQSSLNYDAPEFKPAFLTHV